MNDSNLAEFTFARLDEQSAMIAANFPEAGDGVLKQLAQERQLVETYEAERIARMPSGLSDTMPTQEFHVLYGAVRGLAARWSYVEGYDPQWRLTKQELGDA